MCQLWVFKMLKKDDFVFEVLGDLDELNCFLGLAKAVSEKKAILTKIQKDIMIISSIVSGAKIKFSGLLWLEKKIGKIDKQPKGFVFPGRNEPEVRLQMARAVARRAERRLVKLAKKRKIEKEILDYLNRLSWFLFVISLES